MMQKHTLNPNPSRLIEGLRDTGYDFNTALADIVDNSIDAGARNVDIRIGMEPDGRIVIMVADDGCGMDRTALLDAMTYGATGRNGTHRLGKFGLGLKTASTAFCRRLSVVTRSGADAELLKATWDLDHVVNCSQWELLLDEPNNFEREVLDNVANASSGTLVIWEKVDRLLKNVSNPPTAASRRALEKIIEGFRHHASMVYQRFLDRDDKRARDVRITVNGNPLASWDPFCRGQPKTEVVAQQQVPVEFSDGSKSKCEFTVKAFVLPRREEFSTPEAASDARLTNRMQGIYIYRENRLIHPASWLGMLSKEPHFSLLRVEFSFDHRLDQAFQVDIKKSQIILNETLYTWIRDTFLPAPRKAAEERYRKGQRTKEWSTAKNVHDVSNRSISAKEKDLIQTSAEVVGRNPDEVMISNRMGKVVLKIPVFDSVTPDQICVKPEKDIQDGLLWEPAIIDGHHAVRINAGHEYYRKVYLPNRSSGVTIQGMDFLLWALAEAELSTISEATRIHFRELRYEVSRLLRRLTEDLPEPVTEDGKDE